MDVRYKQQELLDYHSSRRNDAFSRQHDSEKLIDQFIITASSLAITVSGSMLKASDNLTDCSKTLIILSWIFLTLAIFLTIINMRISSASFSRLIEEHDATIQLLYDDTSEYKPIMTKQTNAIDILNWICLTLSVSGFLLMLIFFINRL